MVRGRGCLDPEKNHYRKYGKGYTLSAQWALCQLCEDAYQSDDEDRAVARMMLYDSPWNIDWHMAQRAGIPFDLDESVRKPLRVFRAADLGAQRLPHGPRTQERRRFRPLPDIMYLIGAGVTCVCHVADMLPGV
ncbi:hypothetical protein GCM10009722_00600 [Williamsia deligens]